jgi:AbrB family looped-hinge helix DNA binding protein
MREVKLSTKNQIVIPREIRDALGVKAGDRLLVVPRGDTVILLRKPKKYSKAIAGMAKGLFVPGRRGRKVVALPGADLGRVFNFDRKELYGDILADRRLCS